MDDAEHVRQLDALVARIDSAADRVFAAAQRLSDEVDEAEAREIEQHGDALRVGMRTTWRWRRLERLDDHVDAMTESVVAWMRRVNEIYAERPTGRYRQWRQRRRLLSVARYLERGVDQLGRLHP